MRAVDGRAPVLRTTLKSLLAGPTPAEARDGARTAFVRGTRLLGLRRQGSLVTIQLDRRFLQQTADGAARVTPARLRLSVLQLGRTLSQFPGIHRFRLSVSGQLLEEYPDLGLRWRPDEQGTWNLAELPPSSHSRCRCGSRLGTSRTRRRSASPRRSSQPPAGSTRAR